MQCSIAVTPTIDAEHTIQVSPTAYTYETDGASKEHFAGNALLYLRNHKRLLAVAHVESVTAEKREQAARARREQFCRKLNRLSPKMALCEDLPDHAGRRHG